MRRSTMFNHLTEIGVWKCRAEETGLGHDSSPNATTAGSQLATAGERGVHHSTPDSWREHLVKAVINFLHGLVSLRYLRGCGVCDVRRLRYTELNEMIFVKAIPTKSVGHVSMIVDMI